MKKYIIVGAISFFIGGPIGTLVGIGICIFIDHMNNQEEEEQNIPTNQSKITIEELTPIIDLLCIYALKHEKNWVSDKVKYIKNLFSETYGSHEELLFLRERMKLQNRPNLNQTIHDYLKLDPHINNKEMIFDNAVFLLTRTCSNENIIKQDSIDLGERIGLERQFCHKVIQHHLSTLNKQNQETQHKILSDIEKSANILEVSVHDNIDVIQKAWRKKMQDFHPDRNIKVTDAVRKMIEEESRAINTARDILLEYKKRQS